MLGGFIAANFCAFPAVFISIAAGVAVDGFFYATYDVETTQDKYRFAMEYMLLDTADADNVGIRSLYIIRLADDTDPQFAYRGDEKYTPGININKKSRIPH